jgi:hypothetical protein
MYVSLRFYNRVLANFAAENRVSSRAINCA